MKTTTAKLERKEESVVSSEDWPVIHAYTRAEAIADGVLIAVDEQLAREAGFKVPVAITSEVHEKYVRVPPGVRWQDEAGRLWDILWMTRYAYQSERSGEGVVTVRLHVRNDNRRARPVKLRAQLGPGDDGQCVLTIMLPGEG